MTAAPRLLFFMGKGGVGKSTMAVLSALHISKRHPTLLLSLDPAHNLSDILNFPLTDAPKQVLPALTAAEVDVDKWNRRYLRHAELQFKKAYAYLTTFSLEKHFAVIRNAPGVEAHGLILALEHHLKHSKVRYIVLDTPPTALTLSLLAMPALSLLWLKQLHDLRREIIEKQKLIHTLRFADRDFERDRVMENIQNQHAYWESLQIRFKDSNQSRYILVENDDALSRKENQRIITRMRELELPAPDICHNKTKDENGIPFTEHIQGIQTLQNFIREHQAKFDRLLNIP